MHLFPVSSITETSNSTRWYVVSMSCAARRDEGTKESQREIAGRARVE